VPGRCPRATVHVGAVRALEDAAPEVALVVEGALPDPDGAGALAVHRRLPDDVVAVGGVRLLVFHALIAERGVVGQADTRKHATDAGCGDYGEGDREREAALADALLHPQDRAYSVPQLFDFIANGGLTFGRWAKQAPYSLHCGVIAKIPQASRMAQLPLTEQYAAIELFRGTMVRHSMVAYRNDSTGGLQQISFTGDAWLGYVPIRMADTICVQDRLPPGAAAVLINQTHTYRDLFLPIGPTEKQLFDAIDGDRSIGDIVERTLSPSHRTTNFDMARTFFERLWWYDQVVFDLSSQPVQGRGDTI